MEAIVVGVDGSACSLAALRWAVAEARLRAARVRALYAWSYPHVSTYHQAAHALSTDFAEDAASALAAAVSDVGPDAEGIAVEQVVVESAPAAALIDAAAAASLLVVGSRGHGGFAGLLLGSVSQQCVQHALCPVVVVRVGLDG